MRDITLGLTVYHNFTTRAFSTGIPTLLAGSPVLSVLEEDNNTPITSGVGLTVDRASVVGLNEAIINTTSGYTSGKHYSIYVSTGTIDSVSAIGEVIGEFTIQQSASAVDLANTTDGLGAIKTETSSIQTDTTNIETDTQNIQSRIPAALVSGLMSSDITAISTDTVAADNMELDYDGTGFDKANSTIGTVTTNTDMVGTDSAALATNVPDVISLANINAEVDTALITTSYGEPSQGSPGVNVSIKDKISFMYKFMRNKITNDGNNVRVFADDGSTIDHISLVSSVGGTVTRGEYITG